MAAVQSGARLDIVNGDFAVAQGDRGAIPIAQANSGSALKMIGNKFTSKSASSTGTVVWLQPSAGRHVLMGNDWGGWSTATYASPTVIVANNIA